MQAGRRYASFDGDADRLIYFTSSKDGQFTMLDGDKIATLIASFFKELLDEVKIQCGLFITVSMLLCY